MGDFSIETEPHTPVQLATGRWSRWIAIAGGFGYAPIAPGTAGSLAGVLVFWLVGFGLAAGGLGEIGVGAGQDRFDPLGLYGVVVAALLVVGVYAAGRAEIDFGRRDDGRIVIDEVVGQMIALVPLLPLLVTLEAASLARGDRAIGADGFLLFLEVVTGFVLFRLFDIWKPGLVGWAERRLDGGMGVMADDVMAGLYAAVLLYLLHAVGFARFYSGASSAIGVNA